MTIAIDFDGTVVTHDYPEVGKDIGAVSVLKKLVEKGHQLILYTMRSHKEEEVRYTFVDGNNKIREINKTIDTLQDAIDWFKKNEIPLYGINENPTQKEWTDSSKVYANLYIDDSALGCPLIYEEMELRPYVDWEKVEYELKKINIL